jgi:hypothetical protein
MNKVPAIMHSKNHSNHFGATSLSILYDFYLDMTDQDLYMVYEGEFTQEITKSVLALTEKNFDMQGVDASVKKKVFNVMIESLQNICKHQYAASAKNTEGFSPAIFMIGVRNGDYFIITGNQLVNHEVENLKKRIDGINAEDKEGLKLLYKSARLKSQLSEVGGAGLGLIDMARKSGNKLVYRFDQTDETKSFFSLMTNISTKKEVE